MIYVISLSLLIALISAFFSGSEAALLSINDKSGLNKAAIKLIEGLQKTLCSLVLGNNMSNIVGSFLLGKIAASHLSEVGNIIFPIYFCILIIIIGEIIPKALGEAKATPVLNTVATSIQALNWVFAPLQCVFNFFLKLLPQKEVVQDEEELVEAARSLDSTPIHELMKPGSVEQCPDYCKTVSSFIGKCIEDEMSDVVLKRLYKEEYLIIVLNREGVEIGWVNRDIAFEWLFDHWGE